MGVTFTSRASVAWAGASARTSSAKPASPNTITSTSLNARSLPEAIEP